MKAEKFDMAVAVLAFGVVFLVGMLIGAFGVIMNRPNSIPVSQTALQEMNLACSGNYRDLAVNRKFVYANCVAPFRPVTIQNYRFK